MARYQVILAYDGTNFLGFQRQARGRTVQGTVELALKKIGWRGKSLLVAGRTDRGVHASGQVIAFDIDWKHSTDDMKRALNANLPNNVVARKIRMAQPDFHPRYDAMYRQYQYRLFCDNVRHPLKERYAWRVWPAVEIDAMNKSAKYLVGTYDFAAFGKPPKDGGNTIRSVINADWYKYSDGFVFEITAKSFLYHMVRRLVALFVQVGQGKIAPDIIKEYLRGQGSNPYEKLAPPHGLLLLEVVYPL